MWDYQAALQRQADAHPDCNYCQDVAKRGDTMAPKHDASPNCESGGHNHCTCGICFD